MSLVDNPPVIDAADGSFALPTAPGLGVRLDHAEAARHPRTHARFNLVERLGAPQRRTEVARRRASRRPGVVRERGWRLPALPAHEGRDGGATSSLIRSLSGR